MNRELRNHSNGNPSAIGSTRHIEIDISKCGDLSYETADNLAILPENSAESVASLARSLGYDLDSVIKLEGLDADFKHPFPTPCTVRTALTTYFDIHGMVRHNFLSKLLPYVESSSQREWLRDLVAKDKMSNFKKRIEEDHRTIVDLLANELSSCRLPLEDFFHIVPHLQPRYYTISSSSSVSPKVVHITFSISEYDVNGKHFTGVCSAYARNLNVSSKCKIFIKPSTFRLPKSLSTPIIMIGPGTGIAPMRALLQEREYRSNGSSCGQNILFFGCKHANEDYIYRSELEAFKSRNILNELYLAFSRDQKEKVKILV